MTGWWVAVAIAATGLSPSLSDVQPHIRSPGEPLAAVGVGLGPCSKFNEIDKLDPKWTRDTLLSWAQGFMAGANTERGEQKKDSANVNAMTDDAQWTNLEAFCSDQPDKPFALGVMILYLGLPTIPRAH